MSVSLTKWVVVTGSDAIDQAIWINRGGAITETRSGFCCDTGSYSHESESDAESLFFSLLVYRDQQERISITFTPDRFGNADWQNLVEVSIDTGDAGEWSKTTWLIEPK